MSGKDSKCGFGVVAVLVAMWKNCSNAAVAFHIAVKTRFYQLKNIFNAQISHILCPWCRVDF